MIVVTRHKALLDHLVEEGLVPSDCRVVAHASAEDIRGQHVIGVLPLHLAALAAKVTVVPLTVPAEKRGQELTLEEVRQYAGEPRTYVVQEVAG
jgi:putative CRISPR-associated protein (TIGR02620 family)